MVIKLKKQPASGTLQIKVRLLNINEKIWRRIQVPSYLSLTHLQSVIQLSMGWTSCNYHKFINDDIEYDEFGEEDEDLIDEEIDDFFGFSYGLRKESNHEIKDLLNQKGDTFLYEHHTQEDTWTHLVKLEKILANTNKINCLNAKRKCPPEDCGGPWGYTIIQDILNDPKQKDNKQLKSWLGNEYESSEPNLQNINRALRKYFSAQAYKVIQDI